MDVKACDIPEFWNCSNLYLHARSISMREVGVVYSGNLEVLIGAVLCKVYARIAISLLYQQQWQPDVAA
jgi:hypothetical protein